MAKAEITIPLDIPDERVLQTSLNARGEIIITIESTKAGTQCRKCGKWITKLHGRDEWILIRYLPAFGHPTYLRYRPNRYQCQDCESHPTTTQRLFVRDGKWRKGRAVYLTDVALDALRPYLVVRGIDKAGGYVFMRNGLPVKKAVICGKLKAIGKRVDVHISPHRLRHTFATQLLNIGYRVTSIHLWLWQGAGRNCLGIAM